jgi:hypothetical protein
MRVAITHGSRPLAINHTSGAEVYAFTNVYADYADVEEVIALDYQKLIPQIDQFDAIFIFTASDLDPALQAAIEHSSHSEISLLCEDPNWPMNIHLKHTNIRLVTPFPKLNRELHAKVLPHWSISAPKLTYHYFPFGELYFYSNLYQQSYALELSDLFLESFRPKYDHCYFGSLKEDRIDAIANMIASGGCDFFGNFSESDLAAMLHKHGYQLPAHFKCHGRTHSPYVIPIVCDSYKYVYFAPDSRMLELKSYYLRLIEMSLMRNAKIKPIQGADQHILLQKTKDQLLTFCRFEPQSIAYSPNLQQLKRTPKEQFLRLLTTI